MIKTGLGRSKQKWALVKKSVKTGWLKSMFEMTPGQKNEEVKLRSESRKEKKEKLGKAN